MFATYNPMKNHGFAVSGLAQDWVNARHIGVCSPRSTLGPIDRAAKVAGLKRSFASQAQNFTAALVMASQEGALFTTLKAPFESLAA